MKLFPEIFLTAPYQLANSLWKSQALVQMNVSTNASCAVQVNASASLNPQQHFQPNNIICMTKLLTIPSYLFFHMGRFATCHDLMTPKRQVPLVPMNTFAKRVTHYNDVIMGAIASQITSLTKKTSKLRVTGLCAGNSPGTGEFPAQMASNAENVSIWWRHHDSSNQAITDCVNEIRMRVLWIKCHGT